VFSFVPVNFTPITDDRRRGYAFSGTIALEEFLAGVVELPTKMASPRGTVHILRPEYRLILSGQIAA
jgi:hypothetical protein